MIVKVIKSQVEFIKYECAVLGLNCNVFTIENNPLLLQAEILHDGDLEISPETAWHLLSLVNSVMLSRV